MHQNNIKELPRLNEEKLENIFNVYQIEEGAYYYNLLNTIHFPENLPDSYFDNYTIKYGDTWPVISYKAYRTINLWWVILLANKITNPVTTCTVGRLLKIPTSRLVSEILTLINTNK